MRTNSITSNNIAAPSAAPREAHQGAGGARLQFLIRVCRHRAFAKPLLMLDGAGGHFTTALEFKDNFTTFQAKGI